jgi:hypothetical protein
MIASLCNLHALKDQVPVRCCEISREAKLIATILRSERDNLDRKNSPVKQTAPLNAAIRSHFG